MGQFRDVLLLLNRLKAEGMIHDYAVAGAVAVSLWTEPVATQRQLSPLDKIRILIELQRREVESNGIRRSLGRPVVAMKPWDTRA